MLLKINKILFQTTLFIALLFSNALLIVNLDLFYEFEFQKNNTSFKTGITKTDLEKIVDNTQHFFNEKSNEKIDMTTYINGVEKNDYRTRVSQIFVKEKGEWKVKSGHFTPLHSGSGIPN